MILSCSNTVFATFAARTIASRATSPRVWRDPNADDPLLFQAMATARYLNLPETIDAIGYPVPFDRDHVRRVLSERMESGVVTFGAAYKITGGRTGTISHVVDTVLYRLWRARGHMAPTPGTKLADYCARLMDFDGIGSFMAGQIIADLKYAGALRSAPDWMSFAVSGPGSRRGLNRLLGRPASTVWSSEASWQSAFRQFEAAIRPELERIGLGDLHAQDLQNCLCEVDKYLRAATGEGKPKRRYAGGAIAQKRQVA